jgi:uncharacterized membrane protein
MILILAVTFGIGVVGGLRSLTAPTVVSWGIRFGWLEVTEPWAAFLGFWWTPYVLTALAIGELIADKLPRMTSRKALPAFAFRVIVGGFLGAAIAAGAGRLALIGAACGVAGAVVGTLGGYEARKRLVRKLRVPDFVIALVEDAIAVGTGFLLVSL